MVYAETMARFINIEADGDFYMSKKRVSKEQVDQALIDIESWINKARFAKKEEAYKKAMNIKVVIHGLLGK